MSLAKRDKRSQSITVRQTRRTRPPKRCPECGGSGLWRDGLRHLTDGGTVQRWLCRACGYRFSEKPLNKTFSIKVKRRVCVTLARDTKNLAEKPLETGLAGATTDTETVRGLTVQYACLLEREGYKQSRYLGLIRLLARKGADLQDPENVKTVLAKQPWRDGTKMLAVYAYDLMVKRILKTEWTRPRYVQEETLPFIPEEAELDQLIAACRSRRMAAYLQTLKETFADPSEALGLRWTDITGNVITINHPVKGHNPRQLRVSNKLIAMLNALPKPSNRIFPTTYQSIAICFWKIRQRLARNTQNPRLLNITFRTFRHWGATTTYAKTRHILLVQKLLGHKRIENTMKYTQLIKFKDDEYQVATATTLDEAKQLLKAGFNYVTEINGTKLFRKPKAYKV